jgi:hypothetical protein
MVDQGTKDVADMIRTAVDECRQSMRSVMDRVREAALAYKTKAFQQGRRKVTVEINHLRQIVETQLPRDMAALHPGRPYLPLRANDVKSAQFARIYERAIDNSMDRGGYFPAAAATLRAAETFGFGYIMPYVDVWYEDTETSSMAWDPAGDMMGQNRDFRPRLQDGIRFQNVPVNAVLVPRIGGSLLEKPFIIIRRIVSLAEIERRIEVKRYVLPPGVGTEQLRNASPIVDLDTQLTFEDELSLSSESGIRGDIGILSEFYSDKRWCASWNDTIDLTHGMDQSPRLRNVDRRTKPIAMMRINTGVGPDQFFGEGWYEAIRDKTRLASLVTSQYAHQLMLDSNRIGLYRDGPIDSEQIRTMDYGDMLGVDDTIQDLGQLISSVKFGEPSKELMEFGQFLDERIAQISMQPPIVSGQSPTPRQTARGMGILQSEAQINMGFNAKYLETTYLVEQAALTSSIFGSNTTLMQLADLVGWDDAMIVQSADLRMIPGGYHWQFDGSDRVSQRQLKFERLEKTWSLLSQTPLIVQNPDAIKAFGEEFLEATDMDDRRRDRILGNVAQPQAPPGQPGAPPGAPGTPALPLEQAPAMMPVNEIPTPAGNQAAQSEMGAA